MEQTVRNFPNFCGGKYRTQEGAKVSGKQGEHEIP
jgi:hypothetical protein